MRHPVALVLSCLTPALCAGAAAPAPSPLTAAARIAKAEYCFAVVRRLQPEKNPPPSLVLQVRLDVSYRNISARPVILPLHYDRTLYTSLMPGVMKPTHENLGLFSPTVVTMMRLPANVNPANPVDPPNDEFRIIAAGGLMTLPIEDLVTVPVRSESRPKVDLLGKTLYLRFKFSHRQLAPALEAQLSDKWTRFGVPWTGDLLTNTLVVKVPASPDAADCVDARDPNEGRDIDRSLKLQR